MNGDRAALVRQLYEAFNRRDGAAMTALCDEGIEFFTVDVDEFGRSAPYVGVTGLRDYLADLARTWEELLMTPCEVEREGDRLLIRGRVYVRSHELGIRDMPVGWIWELREGRFARGEVFSCPEDAAVQFAKASA